MAGPDPRLPTIEGHAIRLRWLTERDVPQLFRIFSNAAVTRYWSSEPLATVADAERLLREIHDFRERDTLYQWGIARTSDDAVIGTCTLASIDRRHRSCELGFALHPDEWRKGIARDAVRRLVDWAFEELGMHRIEADIDPRNHSSIRLVEQLGFQKEGLLRERYHMYGEAQDSLIFGLLRKEHKVPDDFSRG